MNIHQTDIDFFSSLCMKSAKEEKKKKKHFGDDQIKDAYFIRVLLKEADVGIFLAGVREYGYYRKYIEGVSAPIYFQTKKMYCEICSIDFIHGVMKPVPALPRDMALGYAIGKTLKDLRVPINVIIGILTLIIKNTSVVAPEMKEVWERCKNIFVHYE